MDGINFELNAPAIIKFKCCSLYLNLTAQSFYIALRMKFRRAKGLIKKQEIVKNNYIIPPISPMTLKIL